MNRLPVGSGSVPVGVDPGLFAGEHLIPIRKTLCRHQFFQRREPVLVVARAIVRLAAIERGVKFLGERRCPLFPGEAASRGKAHCESEGLGLPGLREDRTAFIARKRGQRRELLGIGR